MRKINLFYKKAQFALEYTVVIIVAIGALLTMQAYLRRSVQGRIKEGGEQLGHEYTPEGKIFRWVESSYNATITEQGVEKEEEGSSGRGELMVWCDPDAGEWVRGEDGTWTWVPTHHCDPYLERADGWNADFGSYFE